MKRLQQIRYLVSLAKKVYRGVVVQQTTKPRDLFVACIGQLNDARALGVGRWAELRPRKAHRFHQVALHVSPKSLVADDDPVCVAALLSIALSGIPTFAHMKTAVAVGVAPEIMPQQCRGQKRGPFEHEGLSRNDAVRGESGCEAGGFYRKAACECCAAPVVSTDSALGDGMAALKCRSKPRKVVSISGGKTDLKAPVGVAAVGGEEPEPVSLRLGVYRAGEVSQAKRETFCVRRDLEDHSGLRS